MRCTAKQLLHLPVVTVQGIALGKVRDIEFDLETEIVRQYLVGGLWKTQYRIAPSQVVRIEPRRMVVADTVVNEQITSEKSARSFNPQVGEAISPQQEL